MAMASTSARLIKRIGKIRPAISGLRPIAFITLLPIRPRLKAGIMVPIAIVRPLTNVGLASGEVLASANKLTIKLLSLSLTVTLYHIIPCLTSQQLTFLQLPGYLQQIDLILFQLTPLRDVWSRAPDTQSPA